MFLVSPIRMPIIACSRAGKISPVPMVRVCGPCSSVLMKIRPLSSVPTYLIVTILPISARSIKLSSLFAMLRFTTTGPAGADPQTTCPAGRVFRVTPIYRLAAGTACIAEEGKAAVAADQLVFVANLRDDVDGTTDQAD